MNLIGRGLGIVSLALVVRSFGISSNSCSRILPRTSTVLIQQQQQQHQQEQRNTFRTFSSALNMVRTRGLEKQNLESASPEEGGMTLFLKAGPDGTSVGDCPFAHAVRLVLEEKGLSYDIQPCTLETKPDWLVESYDGKMPALRHRKECYVESSVIMEYLEFFFNKPVSLKADRNTENVLDGFFPAVAEYLKEDKEEEEEDSDKLVNLQEKLLILEDHLGSTGPFLCGDAYSMLDCRLVPQLYHLQTAAKEYKGGVPNLAEEYPNVSKYYKTTTARPSFANTVYSEETVIWGWGNARN